ncbi:MAG TPA: hypothetical protein VF444_16500 [Pseudonocardiaceae bacterium]
MSTPNETVPGARLAEEARLLLDAVAERLQPWLERMVSEHREHEAAVGRPITCEWCPFCAGIAVLRGERPELAVRAAEHAAGLLAILRVMLTEPGATPGRSTATAAPGASGDPDGTDRTDGSDDRPGEPAPSESPRVQRIPVRRPGDARETPEC